MSAGLRQRRPGLQGLVEELDGFTKVVDNVKEEKKATAGFISFVSFAVIFVLVTSEMYSHFFGRRQYDYRFAVDVDHDETPELKMDFVVASPCNSLHVTSTNDLGGGGGGNPFGMPFPMQESIVKDPTRFEFTDEEQLYWTVLRHAHAKMNENGLRGLEDLQYIDEDVEDTLVHLADEKQKEEAEAIKRERKKDPHREQGRVVLMVANGMGMFQMVATSSKDEGTACRIHGKLHVRKGKNEKLLVSLQNLINIVGLNDDTTKHNISHRIEMFNFGPRVTGLVSPLAGAEQISVTGKDVYRYFLKVVPTKIYHGLFGRYTMTYQYSVTFLKKQEENREGGIYFEYEFAATVIEIREVIKTYLQLCLRLCSIVGGVFATSSIINSIVQCILAFFKGSEKRKHGERLIDSSSTSASMVPSS